MGLDTLTPNVWWRPVFWEPVAGTGERLMVGAVVEWEGKSSWRRFIRDDVLDCLYGKASAGAKKLIEHGLETISMMAEGDNISAGTLPGVLGLQAGAPRHTHARDLREALRTAALLYSSLTNLDKLDNLDDVDAPTQEEGNRRFATDVRERVIKNRPDLEKYFGRSAVLIEGGDKTKFGYVSPRSIMHFGVLSPIRQGVGMRDARARLWELSGASKYTRINVAGLIFGVPSADDPTLSNRQLDAMKRTLDEIEREADKNNMLFFPVVTAQAGAEKLIEYA
ncbi:hypothetical protein ACQUFY_21620 [Robbsia andropogonis]|uniref:hypothetical protein n=1 Tax=Robbsia andropogonis TaxID=28092 RepID=UPI003D2004EE